MQNGESLQDATYNLVNIRVVIKWSDFTKIILKSGLQDMTDDDIICGCHDQWHNWSKSSNIARMHDIICHWTKGYTYWS